MMLAYIIVGFLAGIFGGMGMGGGTLLVPLLTFLDVEQKTAQAINLLSFLPMCCCALFFHCKNGLVEKKGLLSVIIPAVVSAVCGALLINVVEQKTLRVLFGVFLLIVGILQLKKCLKKEDVFYQSL